MAGHARAQTQICIGAVDHRLDVGLLDDVADDDFDLHGLTPVND